MEGIKHGHLDNNRKHEFLTPKDVALLMPPSIKKTWLYDHWEDLGGVRIGRKKLILKEIFYANFQKEGLVVCQGGKERKEMDAVEGGYDPDKVEDETRGKTGRGRVKENGKPIRNYSNEFGLVDALQRIPKRRKSQLHGS